MLIVNGRLSRDAIILLNMNRLFREPKTNGFALSSPILLPVLIKRLSHSRKKIKVWYSFSFYVLSLVKHIFWSAIFRTRLKLKITHCSKLLLDFPVCHLFLYQRCTVEERGCSLLLSHILAAIDDIQCSLYLLRSVVYIEHCSWNEGSFL